MKWTLCIWMFLMMPVLGMAQYPSCIDSTMMNSGLPCYFEYHPVCGCNGVTYRNACYADFSGVLQYDYVPCEGVHMNVFNNPVFDYLYLDLSTRYETDVTVYIFDIHGILWTTFYVAQVSVQQVALPFFGFPKGPYVILAESAGATAYQKFVHYGL